MTKIDANVRTLLEQWSKAPKVDISKLTAKMVRESDKEVQKLQESIEAVSSIKEYIASTTAGEIPIKVYTPKNNSENKKTPVFIFFHGGGFVIDSESYESPIRKITNESKYIVCSVQYSLSPEHKFPKAANESVAATQWIVNNLNLFNGDPNRIAIGGDSSGGNLATVVALKNQNNKIHRFKCLILMYPMLDATSSQPSVEEFANGYGFTKEKVHWYFNQYLPKGIDRTMPDVSPFFAQKEEIKNFPPTFMVTPEFDPLRDEAEMFAQKLKNSGVEVYTKRYTGMIHGFFQMSGVLDKGKTLISDVVEKLSIYLR